MAEVQRNGLLRTTATLANVALGSGILGLPAALASGGYAWTFGVMVVFVGLAAITLFAVSRAVLALGVDDYPAAVERAFGARAAVAFGVLVLAKLYGIGIAYLLIAADALLPLIAGDETSSAAPGNVPWYARRETIVSLFALVAVLPLCLARTLRALATASAAGVAAVAVAAAVVLYNAGDALAAGRGAAATGDPPVAMASGWGLLQPVGLVVFAFGCHLQSPQVLAEVADPDAGLQDDVGAGMAKNSTTDDVGCDKDLNDQKDAIATVEVIVGRSSGGSNNSPTAQETDVDSSLWRPTPQTPLLAAPTATAAASASSTASDLRRLAVMDRAVVLTLALSFVLQGATALLAYLQLGADIPGNILNAYTATSASASVARVAMAAAVTLTLPLVQSTARLALHALLWALAQRAGWSRMQHSLGDPSGRPLSTVWHVALTLVYVAAVWGVALVVRDVGVVFGILGSTAGILTNYLIPALLVLQRDSPWRCAARKRGQTCTLALAAAAAIAVVSVPIAVAGLAVPFL